MSADDEYMKWWDDQKKSGPLELKDEHRRKNLQLHAKVKDILPIDDDMKVNDCDLLYRFLIACHWHLEDAEARIRQYVVLRKEKQLNGIIAEPIEPELVCVMTKIYGIDKEGYPCLWIAPDPAELTAVINMMPSDTITRGQMRVMEMSRFVSRYLGVDRATYVIDLGKVTIRGINSQVIGFLKEMTKMLQDFFPELIRRMLIFSSGWAVTAGWKVLKAFVDARIQDKIKFDSKPPSPQGLKDFIAPMNILPEYGGTNHVDEVDQVLQKEIARLRAGGVGREAAPLPLDRNGDLERQTSLTEEAAELYSLYNSFVFENSTSWEDQGGGPRLVLEAADAISAEEVDEDAVRAANELLSPVVPSPLSDELDSVPSGSMSLSLPRGQTEIPDDLRELTLGFTFCMDGSATVYKDSTYIATVQPPHVFENDPSKRGMQTMTCEILQESGHPFHEVLIICDLLRHPIFIVRRNRISSRIKVYLTQQNIEIVTDSSGKHYYSGEVVELGTVGPVWVDSGSRKKKQDKEGWVVCGLSFAQHHKAASPAQRVANRLEEAASFFHFVQSTSTKNNSDDRPVLISGSGLTLTFSGFFGPFETSHLIGLGYTILRMWETVNDPKELSFSPTASPTGPGPAGVVGSEGQVAERPSRGLREFFSDISKSVSSSSSNRKKNNNNNPA